VADMARLELTIENGQVRASGSQISMEDLSRMLTGLAAIVVKRAVLMGASADQVKDAMLDICLGVTEGLTDKKVEEMRRAAQKGNEDERV